jgi:TonB family protein
MRRYGYLLLATTFLAGSGFAQPPSNVDGATTTAPPDCPESRPIRPPEFPVQMVREKRSGSVVLDLEVDACGRVTNASLRKRSRREFNEAAIASVMGASLSAEQLARVEDGHFELEIEFEKPRDIKPAPLNWPATHAHPRYVADSEPIGFATAQQANDAFRDPEQRMWTSPFPVRGSRFVQMGEPGQREFWYFLSVDRMAKLAIRYRPVVEDGEAIVRIAMLCEDTTAACEQLQAAFMQGLPFAKAR